MPGGSLRHSLRQGGPLLCDTSSMAALSRPALRWTALTLLWALVGTVLWLTAVQAFLVALNPFCHLQRPGVSHLAILKVEPNPDSQITDYVTVRQGDDEQVLSMAKGEAYDLRHEDEAWIMEAWYEDGLRPTHFRFSLLRILLEYPSVLLLPATWGLWRVRRARQVAEAEPPPPVRRTFTDDFHMKAQRFAKETPAAEPPLEPPPGPPAA